MLVVFGLLTIPDGAPLRNPDTGALIGNSPFMNSLIVPIMFIFLATGIAYGRGAGTIRTANEVIGAMTKAVSSLGGTILLVPGDQPVHRLLQLQQHPHARWP